MPAEPPPRPGPKDQTLILQRRPKSGFVNYPPFFQKRMVDGRARFMTKCDMLIGPCACGYSHVEWEGWVVDMLQMYNCQVEILLLWGTELGDRGMVVEIPGYWKQGRNWEHSRCDVLVGQCTCGRTHATSERWVKNLLDKHRAVILNMPEVEASAPEPERASRRRSSRPSPSRPQTSRPRTRDAVPTPEGQWTDIIRNGQMDLPVSVRQALETGDDFMPGCDCSDCERQRETSIESVTSAWVRESMSMAQADPSPERSRWETENINEAGQLPGWCNCDSCVGTRLHARNQAEGRPNAVSGGAAEVEVSGADGEVITSVRLTPGVEGNIPESWWSDAPPMNERAVRPPSDAVVRFMNSAMRSRSSREITGGNRFWVPPTPSEADVADAEAMVDLNMQGLVSDTPPEGNE